MIELFNNSLKVFRNGKVEEMGKCGKNKGMFYEKKTYLRNGYERISLYFNDKCKYHSVHRIIGYTFLRMDITDTKCHVDHIDRNPLNNELSNLRLASISQNNQNRKWKGYTYSRKIKRFRPQIRVDGKSISLGTFILEEDASNAYLEARRKYFGEFA